MGIIAWIVLGLGAGLLANMLIPGRRSQGLILTCVIGVAWALLGGWLATKLFHVVTLHGFGLGAPVNGLIRSAGRPTGAEYERRTQDGILMFLRGAGPEYGPAPDFYYAQQRRPGRGRPKDG